MHRGICSSPFQGGAPRLRGTVLVCGLASSCARSVLSHGPTDCNGRKHPVRAGTAYFSHVLRGANTVPLALPRFMLPEHLAYSGVQLV